MHSFSGFPQFGHFSIYFILASYAGTKGFVIKITKRYRHLENIVPRKKSCKYRLYTPFKMSLVRGRFSKNFAIKDFVRQLYGLAVMAIQYAV